MSAWGDRVGLFPCFVFYLVFILSFFPSPVVKPGLKKVSLDHEKQQFFTGVSSEQKMFGYNKVALLVWHNITIFQSLFEITEKQCASQSLAVN